MNFIIFLIVSKWSVLQKVICLRKQKENFNYTLMGLSVYVGQLVKLQNKFCKRWSIRFLSYRILFDAEKVSVSNKISINCNLILFTLGDLFCLCLFLRAFLPLSRKHFAFFLTFRLWQNTKPFLGCTLLFDIFLLLARFIVGNIFTSSSP